MRDGHRTVGPLEGALVNVPIFPDSHFPFFAEAGRGRR